MSATKHYLNTNCHWSEESQTFRFNDGFPEKAPEEIMQQRLRKAGLLKDESPQVEHPVEQFKYDCDDYTRHRFYQAINSGNLVHIDVTWYNVYLAIKPPSDYICTVQWFRRNTVKTEEILVDFVTDVDGDRFAFWFDEETSKYYCRKLINCTIPF